MAQNKESFQEVWSKIVAKAWNDPSFKKKLMQDPNEVLKSHGVEIQSGMKVVINENTKNTCYLTLPQKPSGNLTEKQLSEIAAGINLAAPTPDITLA